MQTSNKSIHPSKIDPWIGALLLLAVSATLFSSIHAITAGSPLPSWALLPTLGLGVGLPLWILCATSYTLEPNVLMVRSGPFTWKVPVQDISSVTATSNLLSSPALSADRLRIDYGRGKSVLISPRDKQQFPQEIHQLRPDIHHVGNASAT